MKFVYEAVIRPLGNGAYEAFFPDLGIRTFGSDMADVASMAQDLLENYLVVAMQKGTSLPTPVIGRTAGPAGYSTSFFVDCDADTPQEETMTVAEAADVLDVSEKRIYEMILAGTLAARKSYAVDAASVMRRFNEGDGDTTPSRENTAQLFTCDFELVDGDGRVVAIPVGLDGATEGRDERDAVRMAADWLYETAIDYLVAGDEWPDLPLGTEPKRGGRMIALAVRASLDQIPSMTAAEAARKLGVSTARVAQLCKAGLLESWKVGGTRMVSVDSVDSVDARIECEQTAGRPRKEAVGA